MAKKATEKRLNKNGADRNAAGQFLPGHRAGFQSGQSGNPAGRPKSITLSESYRKQLAQPFPDDPQGRTFAEVIAAKLVMSAATGEVGSAREVADRTEGKPRQALDIDLSVLDWRQMAKEFGLSEEDVIREALQFIQSADIAGDADADREAGGG